VLTILRVLLSFVFNVQFAQFALLTQTLSVFGLYILQFIDSHKVKVIIFGQFVSLSLLLTPE